MRSFFSVVVVAIVVSSAGAANAAYQLPPRPYDVAAAGGHLYVLENGTSRVAQRNQDGSLIRYFGSYGKEEGQLARPMAIAADPLRKRIYVADSNNHRVSAFSLDGQYLYSFGGFALLRQPGKFSVPSAIAVGPQRGYIYVSDRNGMIQVFTPRGAFIRWWGHRRGDQTRGQWLYYVDALTVANNRVYAADRVDNKLRVFTAAGLPVASYGPTLGDWPLDRPSGVAVSPDGTIYLADAYEHLAGHSRNEKVLRLDQAGKLISIWGNYCATCSRGTNNRDPLSFWSPQGVELAYGKLYVAEAGNNRVQVLSPDGAFLGAF